MSEIKTLEYSTLKVPYEIFNKKYRAAQKAIDREVDHVMNASRQVEEALNSHKMGGVDVDGDCEVMTKPPPAIADVTELVGAVAQKLQVLKRKAEESIADELSMTQICKRRLEHLKGIIPPTRGQQSSVEGRFEQPLDWQARIEQWRNVRTDRLVVEHLLRMGYYETAEKLASCSDIRHLTNLEIFKISREVETDLAQHSTAKCIRWCIDNKSKLRKINSKIEFSLRLQEFIELVRAGRRFEAVIHARKHFASYDKPQWEEICKCMVLLVEHPDTKVQPYSAYFDPGRWDKLVMDFRNENYRLFQLSAQSAFSVALQMGLSVLKTPQCYSTSCKKPSCPVCQDDFNRIAERLPQAYAAHSRINCRITGYPLNEHNHPMMLPNGQIFGELALREITNADGVVVCPITQTKYSNPKIEKVFIM